jgi:CelD/BcsL family acetyltransferase involved in cellulose biosynthesis
VAYQQEITKNVTPLNGSSAPPAWWPDLFERASNASILHAPAWIQSWLETYGHEFDGFWVHWDVGGVPVGGCLILQRTVWRHRCPMSTVYLNTTEETSDGSPHMEFNGPLYVRGMRDVIAEELAALLATKRWTRLVLNGYEESAIGPALLRKLPLLDTEHQSGLSRYVDLTAITNNDYEATLSSKTRSQIRRSRRMYEAEYGPVTIDAPADAEEAIGFLTELAKLHNATWRSRGIKGAFECTAFTEFHHHIIRRLWPQRGAEVLRARAGKRVIGYVYSFLLDGKVYCFQTGLVQEPDKNLKPGMLAHALAIRHYCERGLREYDFLAGEVRYKRSMAKSYRTLLWSTAFRQGAYSRLLLLARDLRRKFNALRRPGGTDAEDDEEGAPSEAQPADLHPVATKDAVPDTEYERRRHESMRANG